MPITFTKTNWSFLFPKNTRIIKQLEKHLYWAEIRLRHPCDEEGGTTQTNAN